MQTLLRGAKRLRFELRPKELDAFRAYLEELEAARPRLRLTALTDPEAVQRRHFLEPLALLAALERLGPLGADVIDIGSGAGFPGVPIKIVRPELRLTLLEANGKRAAFLERLVQRLGLENVTVVNRRAALPFGAASAPPTRRNGSAISTRTGRGATARASARS